jgi:alkaline phosphatase D
VGGRAVVFRRPEEALDLGGGRLVARSVDNYRDLYRTYRSDPDLQRLHESFPMIAIWDDHEFSNDCHGATATYEEGRRDELDLQRRAAADQAWFEYMPLDDAVGPATPFAAEEAFPENFAIYRGFVFGQHVELVMTDVRRYRPDHVVPEDAFPAAIFATEDEVLQSEGELPVTEPVPCVDIASYEEHAAFLRAHAETLGFRADAVAGLLSVEGVNALIEQAGDPLAPPPLDPGAEGGLRGYAVHQLLKRAGFTNAGARYLVAVEPFGVYSRKRYRETEGASERLFGTTQREWFLDTLQRSSRTFKFWGTSLCFMPRHIDMTGAEPLPPELQTRIAISAEDWDGCPNERTALLRELAGVRNVVALSGDLHCFFVGVPFDSQEPSNRMVEFVTGAVSSSTWLTEIREIAESDPSIPPAVALAATGVGSLLVDPARRPNPHLAFQELERNGVTVLEVDGQMLRAELLSLPADIVATKPDAVGEAWLLHSRSDRFQVRASTGELERDIQGRVWRWDLAQASWVAL